ncbi:hypothetical protein ACVLD2_004533 [Paenibacillus sp. PvR052]|nr:hypothetical protein [Paenibacillus sp. PvP091]MBP1172218.1 hypothetical protein [Paenibacillus sp. PvR098]MBP2438599.1 hypothetical protein [Paenibacillus sp. PvP052]
METKDGSSGIWIAVVSWVVLIAFIIGITILFIRT